MGSVVIRHIKFFMWHENSYRRRGNHDAKSNIGKTQAFTSFVHRSCTNTFSIFTSEIFFALSVERFLHPHTATKSSGMEYSLTHTGNGRERSHS